MADVIPFPSAARVRPVEVGEPVAAWRMPSGMLLPAHAVAGAPPVGVEPVPASALGETLNTDLGALPTPAGRHPAADVWAGRRPPIDPAELKPSPPPPWWRAWLASVRVAPAQHLVVFAVFAAVGTALALLGGRAA